MAKAGNQPLSALTDEQLLEQYRNGRSEAFEALVERYRQELFRLEAEEGQSWAELEMLLGRQLFDANSVAAR